MTLTNELKQSDMLKMKCQEKDDQIEVLESDVTYVDVTHVMTVKWKLKYSQFKLCLKEKQMRLQEVKLQ